MKKKIVLAVLGVAALLVLGIVLWAPHAFMNRMVSDFSALPVAVNESNKVLVATLALKPHDSREVTITAKHKLTVECSRIKLDPSVDYPNPPVRSIRVREKTSGAVLMELS